MLLKNDDIIEQMIRVATKYYEQGLSQEEIARSEFVSRSSVCRILQNARDQKVVTFRINYPSMAMSDLESEFKQVFDVDYVNIAPSFSEDIESRIVDTCKLVVEDLQELLDVNDYLAVGWGTTMETFASVFRLYSSAKSCAKVVLMNGSLAGNIESIKSSAIVETIAKCLQAEGFLLPVPLVVDSIVMAEILAEDSHVKRVLDYARQARIALFSVGAVSTDSVLAKGAYKEEEYEEIMLKDAVGDLVGRYFDINGVEISSDISKRIMGLTYEEVKGKEIRMGVAVGEVKAKAIIGALAGKVINRFYTDQNTARAVLDEYARLAS
jgi:deoxyribonucleoside regulator